MADFGDGDGIGEREGEGGEGDGKQGPREASGQAHRETPGQASTGPARIGEGQDGEGGVVGEGGHAACPGAAPASTGEDEKVFVPSDEESLLIKGGRNRAVQLTRTGKRRLFKGKLRQEFLEWFAATANVVWSARKIGICHQTVWRHRMNDPGFAEDFDRALDQGMARVRAKLIESKEKRAPIAIGGDYEAPELDDLDPQIALNLLREHESGRGGPAAGFGRKQGRRPRTATNAEVRAALVKRLAAFGVRVGAEESGEAQGEGKGGDSY